MARDEKRANPSSFGWTPKPVCSRQARGKPASWLFLLYKHWCPVFTTQVDTIILLNLTIVNQPVNMQMGGWEDYLHFKFRGEHVLFEILPLDSYGNFLVGSVLTAILCLLER